MQIIRKHVEDPLRNRNNQVTGPLVVSSGISLVHVVMLLNVFRIGVAYPVTCTVLNKQESSHADEILNSLMIIVVPILAINIYNLQEYKYGILSEVLKPFIEKQDILAFNQIVQILLEVGSQIVQIWQPGFDGYRAVRGVQQVASLL